MGRGPGRGLKLSWAFCDLGSSSCRGGRCVPWSHTALAGCPCRLVLCCFSPEADGYGCQRLVSLSLNASSRGGPTPTKLRVGGPLEALNWDSASGEAEEGLWPGGGVSAVLCWPGVPWDRGAGTEGPGHLPSVQLEEAPVWETPELRLCPGGCLATRTLTRAF